MKCKEKHLFSLQQNQITAFLDHSQDADKLKGKNLSSSVNMNDFKSANKKKKKEEEKIRSPRKSQKKEEKKTNFSLRFFFHFKTSQNTQNPKNIYAKIYPRLKVIYYSQRMNIDLLLACHKH